MTGQEPDTLSDKVLMNLSCYIGHEWELLAYNLGLTRQQVSSLAAQYRHNQRDKVFNMLVTWRDINRNKPVEVCIRAMETSGRKDLAQKLHCDKWTKQKGTYRTPTSGTMLVKIEKVRPRTASLELPKVNDLNPSTAPPVHSHNAKFVPVG